MKKKILIAIITMLICTTCLTHAVPPEGLKGFFPDTKTITNDTTVKSEFNEYPWYNYCFDVEKGKGIIDISAGLNQIPNAIFMLLVLLTKFSVFILISCYKVNIYELAPEAINALVGAVNDVLFNGFSELVISLTGVYGIWRTYKGEKTSGWKITITSIVVLGLSVAFFRDASLLANGLNKVSSGISTAVLQQTVAAGQSSQNKKEQIVTNSSDAVVLMGNLFWDICVKKPWELIEYGSIGTVANSNDILKLDVGSEEREDLASDYAKDNPFFRGESFGARVALTLIMLLLGLIYNICILIIAGAIIFNHLCSLFWLCFAGVFFLAALYPSNGLRVLSKWALETFGFQIKKIIITVALSIYFGLALKLFTWTDKYGYGVVIALNILLLIIAIVKHQKVFELLMGLFTADQGVVNRGMQKDSLGSKISNGMMTAYAGQRIYSGMKNRMEKNRQNNYYKKNSDKAEEVLTQRYNNEKMAAKRQAEGTLNERYQKEKAQADQRANTTGKAPEYSRFVLNADQRNKDGLSMWSEAQIQENLKESAYVTQVDDRKKRGYSLFSENQIRATTSQMYKLKQEGNDPDRLLYTDVEHKNGGAIIDDQEEKDQRISDTRQRLEDDSFVNNEKIEDYIESQPGEHFKPKAYVNSKAREGMRRLFNPTEVLIKAAAEYSQSSEPVQSYYEDKEDDVIYVPDKLKLNAAEESADRTVWDEAEEPVDGERMVVNETLQSDKTLNLHNKQHVVEDRDINESTINKTLENKETSNTEELKETNVNSTTTNIKNTYQEELDKEIAIMIANYEKEVEENERRKNVKNVISTVENLSTVNTDNIDKTTENVNNMNIIETNTEAHHDNIKNTNEFSKTVENVNTTVEDLSVVNSEKVNKTTENIKNMNITETNTETHQSNIQHTNESMENKTIHDTNVINEDIKSIKETNKTVENKHTDIIKEQNHTTQNQLIQNITEIHNTEVNSQASEPQKSGQAIGFGEVALFSQVLNKGKKNAKAENEMKEMIKKMTPQGKEGE